MTNSIRVKNLKPGMLVRSFDYDNITWVSPLPVPRSWMSVNVVIPPRPTQPITMLVVDIEKATKGPGYTLTVLAEERTHVLENIRANTLVELITEEANNK